MAQDSSKSSRRNVQRARLLSDECSKRIDVTDEPITKYYKLGRPIGKGKYGKVLKAGLIKDPDFTVAVKVIKLRKIKTEFEAVVNEIKSLKKVSHPNIVKILEIFRDAEKLYIVMEYIKGQELFDFVVSRYKLSEAESSLIVEQLLKTVKYLNSMGICHRDLKPENIMVDTTTLKVKLLDFGFSTYFDSHRDLTSPVGTPYYVAPEVLKGNYSKE